MKGSSFSSSAASLLAIFFCYMARFSFQSHPRDKVQELDTFEPILKRLVSACSSDLCSLQTKKHSRLVLGLNYTFISQQELIAWVLQS